MTQNTLARSNNIIISKLTVPVCAFALLVIIGRHSNLLLGEYAVVMTWFFILQSLPFLGLTAFVVREIARQPHKAGSYFSMMSIMSLLMCGIINLLLVPLLPTLHYSGAINSAITIIGYAIIPGILAFLSETVLISLGHTRPVAIIAVIENVLRLILSALLLRFNATIESLILILLFTRLFALILYLGYFYIIKQLALIGPIDSAILKKTITVLPTFFINTILALIITRFDYIFLSLNTSAEQCGYYAVAYRVLDITLLIILSVILSFFPNMAREFAEKPLQFATRARNLFTFALIILIPAALLGYILSDWYVKLFFANQYPHPVNLTQVFCLSVIIVGIDALLTSFLQATDRQNDDLKALVIGCVVYISLLFILVPRFGTMGAAIAMPLASWCQATIRFIFISKRFGPLAPVTRLIGFAVKGTICFLPVFFLVSAHTWLATGLAVIIVIVCYPAILLMGSLSAVRSLISVLWKVTTTRPVNTIAGCLDHIIADIVRYQKFFPDDALPNQKSFYTCLGLRAAILYRLSHYFFTIKNNLLSRFFWQINIFLTKTDIPPSTYFGPGVVLLAPCCLGISAGCGSRVTFAKLAGVGISGKTDAGKGPGITNIGDNVYFGTRAGALGGFAIPAHTELPPHTLLRRLSIAKRFFKIRSLKSV